MIAILLALTNAYAEPKHLSLSEYVNEVVGSSPAMQSAKLNAESGERRANGASVLTFPYLFGGLSSYEDKSETMFPLSQGTGTDGNAYSLGVGMNTDLGLNGKYSWNTSYMNTTGITLPTSGRYTSYNKLDLTLNLARNGFGSEVKARKDLIRSGNLAQGLVGKFQMITSTAQAEGAYWRLAFARQSVQIAKDGLSRSEKLLGWAKRRVGLQLGDRGDLLQAQANYDLKNLDLSASIEEEKNSARAFNILRNETNDSVPEAVALPSIEETLKMQAPSKSGERLDIQATAERTKALQAQAQLDKEALKPSVDLVGSYAWNGREPDRPAAISEAFGNKHPSKSIALTFSVPLNVPTWMNALKGANQEIEAEGLDLEQARLNEVKDWNDLSIRFAEARKRLQLTNTVETVQKEKYENERQRLLRGRSTTFQALNFEQDYASAQLLRLRTQSEVLQILAQLKTFGGTQ